MILEVSLPPDPITRLNDPPPLRREDLADLAAGYLQRSRGPQQWRAVSLGLGGLALGALLLSLRARLGWPASVEPYLFFGGWAIMLSAGVPVWRRERRLRQQYHFACPACEAVLLDGIRDAAGRARVELVVATGNCPRCGAHILAP